MQPAYDAFAAGDIPGVLATLDPAISWHAPSVLPHGGTFSGHEGVGQFFAGIGSAWEGLTVSVDSVVASEDRVVVLGRASGTLRAGGRDAAYGFVHAWTLGGDGRAVRFSEYVDPDGLLAGA